MDDQTNEQTNEQQARHGTASQEAHGASPQPAAALSITQAAECCGLSVHTLRYYEREGLITGIARDSTGQRRYTAEDVAWIGFLTRLRATGMPVARMRRFARMRAQGPATLRERRELLTQHRADLAAQISTLEDHLNVLEDKITHYDALTDGR